MPMNNVNLYGINNCDTMQKAINWLEAQRIDYHFHDYKKAGNDSSRLASWLKQVPWEELINQRGTTWRKLPDELKQNINNDRAIELMLSHSSLIKRPVLELDRKIYLGFSAELYQQLFGC